MSLFDALAPAKMPLKQRPHHEAVENLAQQQVRHCVRRDRNTAQSPS